MRIKTYNSFRLPLSDFYGMAGPFKVQDFVSAMRSALDEIEKFANSNDDCSMQTSVLDDDDEYFNENISINYEREETPAEKDRRLEREKKAAERKILEEKSRVEYEKLEYEQMLKYAKKFGVKIV